jgi:protein-L-isoaspartate O-methyltransferase
MPVADKDTGQMLVRVVRAGDGHDRTERLEPVRFVPLIGAQGWPEGDPRGSVDLP